MIDIYTETETHAGNKGGFTISGLSSIFLLQTHRCVPLGRLQSVRQTVQTVAHWPQYKHSPREGSQVKS